METIDIELTRLFVKVVQHGGFSKAAGALKMPKSTISKGIAKLETLAGAKLLMRTTRSQTLTEVGRQFYENCFGPIQILEDAQKSLSGADSILSGRVRITAPEDLGSHVVAPTIAAICKRHSALTFELDFSNQIVDLVKDGFDLGIRIGELKENRLKFKEVGLFYLVPVAAQKYLANHAKISHPKQLKDHHCLVLNSTQLSQVWHLKSNREKCAVEISSKISCNQMTTLIQLAVSGAGVAFVPNYLCQDEIQAGRLIRILPQWAGASLPVSIVSPLSMSSTQRLKVVSEELFRAIHTAIA